MDPTSVDMEDIGRTRYPGTSFILRYEAKLPSGVVPASRCGESHDYAFPIRAGLAVRHCTWVWCAWCACREAWAVP